MKRHYEVLDGLRGTAALLTVAFHVMEMLYPELPDNPLRHAYLGVDFFYALSGFVVGHAYDDRVKELGLRKFLMIRLRRLHPLVVLGMVIGLVAFVLDPFNGSRREVSMSGLLLVFASMLFLAPARGIPDHPETHPLNGPAWSLLQEYLANVAYAILGPKLGRRGLFGIVTVSAGVLVLSAATRGHLHGGWEWGSMWLAPVRTVYPFFVGLLLHRLHVRVKIPAPFVLLSLGLAAVFAAPWLSMQGPVKLNGLFDAACVVVVFPMIVVMGAGAGQRVPGRLGALCRFFGLISYPLYITHYPFLYVYAHWVSATKAARWELGLVGAGVGLWVVLVAWLAARFFDLPVRAWLARPRKERGLPGAVT